MKAIRTTLLRDSTISIILAPNISPTIVMLTEHVGFAPSYNNVTSFPHPFPIPNPNYPIPIISLPLSLFLSPDRKSVV